MVGASNGVVFKIKDNNSLSVYCFNKDEEDLTNGYDLIIDCNDIYITIFFTWLKLEGIELLVKEANNYYENNIIDFEKKIDSINLLQITGLVRTKDFKSNIEIFCSKISTLVNGSYKIGSINEHSSLDYEYTFDSEIIIPNIQKTILVSKLDKIFPNMKFDLKTNMYNCQNLVNSENICLHKELIWAYITARQF